MLLLLHPYVELLCHGKDDTDLEVPEEITGIKFADIMKNSRK